MFSSAYIYFLKILCLYFLALECANLCCLIHFGKCTSNLWKRKISSLRSGWWNKFWINQCSGSLGHITPFVSFHIWIPKYLLAKSTFPFAFVNIKKLGERGSYWRRMENGHISIETYSCNTHISQSHSYLIKVSNECTAFSLFNPLLASILGTKQNTSDQILPW